MLFASLAVEDIITCPDSLEVFSHDCKTFFFYNKKDEISVFFERLVTGNGKLNLGYNTF